MPDWSYRTIFRPLLFRLPFPRARDLALGSMGLLSRLPLGGSVIDFMGHMRPDPRLRTRLGDLVLDSPVTIGPWLDRNLVATAALARFGVGLIEIGPIAPTNNGEAPRVCRDAALESLCFDKPSVLAAAVAQARLARQPGLRVPAVARIAAHYAGDPLDSIRQSLACIERVRRHVQAYSLELPSEANSPSTWSEHLAAILPALQNQPFFVALSADRCVGHALELLHLALEHGAAGIIIDGMVSTAAGHACGQAAFDASLAATARLRQQCGPDVPIVAGGAFDPESALKLLAAGATAIQLDAALAFAGPGLPKRINEAALAARLNVTQANLSAPAAAAQHAINEPHAASMSWFWALLLGIAMTSGGLLALIFAVRGVLLPYDEAHLGMTAADLNAINPRLLAFMAHDRVTLAGTMLAIGLLYTFLAWFGIRRGQHWAKIAVVASAFAGFFTFFLFLGFGYFDPFHAFVTAILFQFLLLALQGRLTLASPARWPNLRDDWRWRLANWGQLLLVIQGLALIVAGLTICVVGSTHVFVPEDLEFMGTTADVLQTANPRLIPVIAHDRASFGGMLLSVGIATLLPALRGIRQGERWLWAMFALAGTIAYDATLAVHLHVGYMSAVHLAPAFGGLALLWLALGLLFPYLFVKPGVLPATAQQLQEYSGQKGEFRHDAGAASL
jgi:dihydroorotate dehydrogenase